MVSVDYSEEKPGNKKDSDGMNKSLIKCSLRKKEDFFKEEEVYKESVEERLKTNTVFTTDRAR